MSDDRYEDVRCGRPINGTSGRALGLGGKTEDTIVSAQTSAEIDKAMHQGHAAVTTNVAALIGSGSDVVVEATGNSELEAKQGHMAILKKTPGDGDGGSRSPGGISAEDDG